jgi:hypothetical protein
MSEIKFPKLIAKSIPPSRINQSWLNMIPEMSLKAQKGNPIVKISIHSINI